MYIFLNVEPCGDCSCAGSPIPKTTSCKASLLTIMQLLNVMFFRCTGQVFGIEVIISFVLVYTAYAGKA